MAALMVSPMVVLKAESKVESMAETTADWLVDKTAEMMAASWAHQKVGS